MSNLHAVPAKRTRHSVTKDVEALRQAAEKAADQQKQPPKLEDDERETLVMLRSTLKARIAEAPTHAIAALIRQFRDLDKEIRAIDAKAQREADESIDQTDEPWRDDDI